MSSSKTKKSRGRRRRSSVTDDSETPSLSVDISEREQNIEKEAQRRAEERRKLLEQFTLTATTSINSPKKKKKHKKTKSKSSTKSTKLNASITISSPDGTLDTKPIPNDNDSMTTEDEPPPDHFNDLHDLTDIDHDIDLLESNQKHDKSRDDSLEILHPEHSNDVISNHSNDLDVDEVESDDDDEDDGSDFGLYDVSYDDLQDPKLDDVSNKMDDTESQSLSRSGSTESLYSGSESPNIKSRSKRKGRKRKRVDTLFEGEEEDSDSDLERLGSVSPPRKRRKKNKKKMEDDEVEFDILNEIEVDSDDMEFAQNGKATLNENDIAALDALINSSTLNRIDEKFDSVFDQLHAPPPSDHETPEPEEESDLEQLSPHKTNNDDDEKTMEDEASEEEEEDENKEKIMIKINKPPPKVEKYFKIIMLLDQEFHTIIAPLEQKCGKKILSLTFDGEKIENDCTPQKLIDDLDYEAEDLIDATYS